MREPTSSATACAPVAAAGPAPPGSAPAPEAARRLDAVLDAFVAGHTGRSVAAEVLAGPAWREGREDGVSRPAASVLKVPIVIAVHQAASAGRIDLGTTVSCRDLPVTEHVSFLDVLDRDHAWTVGELCGLALVTSANPIAEHLLGLVGRDAVNRLLQSLGCSGTHLAAGFDDADLGPRGRANVMTAGDGLRLLRFLYESPVGRPVLEVMRRSLYASRLPARLPEGLRVANKTGSLAGVVNDVGVIWDDRVAVSVVVLCDGEDDGARAGVQIADLAAGLWEALAR